MRNVIYSYVPVGMQAGRTYTCSPADEVRNKRGPPDVCYKNDKTCHGNEQAFTVSAARFDAEPIVMEC